MSERTLEVDYVIVGAGAVALAFADTLLEESDATMAIVDRRAQPGGHWNDAYGFVRLHSSSAMYGVNSRALGDEALQQGGLNDGLQHLATGEEICAYFQDLMRDRFLPSGRVQYLPQHDYRDGAAHSLQDGSVTRLVARKKIVDATWAETRIPATHQRAFDVAPGVTCVAPNALPAMSISDERFVVLGAGKTAIDTVIWLQTQGVAADAITWVRPREPWLLNRHQLQSDFAFFDDTFNSFALELEITRDAATVDELYAGLEAAGIWRRIDRTVTPTMYRCAIVSDAELELARRVQDVVRLGHMRAIEADKLVFAKGERAMAPDTICVDCTGDGLPKRAPAPIFQPGVIALQYVRRCSPTFSAAMIAHIEAAYADDEERNRLATPVPLPREPLDWVRMHVADGRNRYAWSKDRELQLWMARSRLDGYSAMVVRSMFEPTGQSASIQQRYRAAQRPGMARMQELLTEAEKVVTGLVTVTDSIAHDLRTPISRMRRRLEEGLAADPAEAKQAALEQALAETDRTIATFTALIDISRAEGGISRESTEDVDLTQIVRDAYDLFEPLAEEKGVAFRLEVQPVAIRGHRALLMQAVSNLIHNAIKYGHAAVEVSLTTSADGAEIVVADDGPGIPSEHRADAVKRFKQVGTQSPEGVGLGLAIVDACARLHRGALALEDNGPGLLARLSLAAK